MTEANITSEHFSIDGTTIEIRLIGPSDHAQAQTLSASLQRESKSFHSMGGFHQLSGDEISAMCDSESLDSIGIIAMDQTQQGAVAVGAARYTKNPITLSHEMAITVSNAYRDTRLALELANFLIMQARKHQVKSLYCVDSDSNIPMRKLAKDLQMAVRLDQNNAHTVVYSLNVDEHQGVVMF